MGCVFSAAVSGGGGGSGGGNGGGSKNKAAKEYQGSQPPYAGCPPYDIVVTPIQFTISMVSSLKFSLEGKSATKTNDEPMMTSIVQYGEAGRPLIAAVMDMAAAWNNTGPMAIAAGQQIEHKMFYDMIYGPATTPWESCCVVCPVQFENNFSFGAFSTKVDGSTKGFEVVNNTISQYYTAGWGLCLYQFGDCSSSMSTGSSVSQCMIKLVFQRPKPIDGQEPPPPYSDWISIFITVTQTMVGKGGFTQTPFDLVSVLNQYGQQGYDMVCLQHLAHLSVGQDVGTGKFNTVYQVIMQRGANVTPVKFRKKQVKTEMKVGFGGATGTSNTMEKIKELAQVGWRYKGQISLATKAKGMKVVTPTRLYFSCPIAEAPPAFDDATKGLCDASAPADI